MGTSQLMSSISFELKVIEAKGIKLHSETKGNLFVRCYLPLGNNISNKRSTIIKFNTNEIPTTNDDSHVWNQLFSLDCTSDDVAKLKQQSLVFEVRLRRKLIDVFGVFFLGVSKTSLLLGKSEVLLEEVLGSPNMVFDKWVCVILTRGGQEEAKMKVEIRVNVRRIRRVTKLDECSCNRGDIEHGIFCACDDYDVFALTNQSS